VSKCIDCPAGFYCGAASKKSVDDYKISGPKRTIQTLCPAGYECSTSTSVPTKLTAGLISRNGEASVACDKGYACPNGDRDTTLYFDCSLIPGYYSDVTGLA
jgi:hypothetical protein